MTMPIIKPIQDRIWVEKIKDPETTPSGLFIPATARDKRRDQAQRGRVLAVGPGRYQKDGQVRRVDPAIEPGVVVLWGKHGATETKLPYFDEEVVMVQEDDVLGVEAP